MAGIQLFVPREAGIDAYWSGTFIPALMPLIKRTLGEESLKLQKIHRRDENSSQGAHISSTASVDDPTAAAEEIYRFFRYRTTGAHFTASRLEVQLECYDNTTKEKVVVTHPLTQ